MVGSGAVCGMNWGGTRALLHSLQNKREITALEQTTTHTKRPETNQRTPYSNILFIIIIN